MALIVATPYQSSGIPYPLLLGDNFVLPANVLVYSTDKTPVMGSDKNQHYDIHGTLMGANGIRMGDDDSDYGNKLFIASTGTVASVYNGGDAVQVKGGQASIVNEGLIAGSYGIWFYTSAGTGSSITNAGKILTSQSSIGNNTAQNIKLVNTGSITSYDDNSYVSGGSGKDTIINKGTMSGDIRLGSNVDSYDGNGGRMNGRVYGEGGADTLKGGAFVDKLDGGSENDKIAGRGGKDILTGGSGADKFYYYAVSELGDTITDFKTEDFFYFKSSAFGNATVGVCSAANFWSNTTGLAHDSDDRFIYDTAQDRLWFDQDGTGPVKPVLVTDFAYDVALTRADIIIFA